MLRQSWRVSTISPEVRSQKEVPELYGECLLQLTVNSQPHEPDAPAVKTLWETVSQVGAAGAGVVVTGSGVLTVVVGSSDEMTGSVVGTTSEVLMVGVMVLVITGMGDEMDTEMVLEVVQVVLPLLKVLMVMDGSEGLGRVVVVLEETLLPLPGQAPHPALVVGSARGTQMGEPVTTLITA